MTQPASPPQSRLVYVLPRIRLKGRAFGQERFQIAKAKFLPDEQKSWNEVICLPRPQWLEIYRDFAYLHRSDPPAPAHGTLIVSTDDDWLRKHISRLIAVTFVMGIEENGWRVPADAFQYSWFEAKPSPNELVALHTKSGPKIEDAGSLQLTPSLELRGIPGEFRVDLGRDLHQELIRRFDSNPYDRLTAACYHLFRTQFDNPITASTEQDFAAYCACLEAAFDIQGPDYSKELSDRLTAMYGEHPVLERWIKGLYSERSVFNHGIAAEPTLSSPDDRTKALAEFRERTMNWDFLRHLCLDVLRDQLQESLDSSKRAFSSSMSLFRKMLCQFFDSETLWHEIEKVFTQSKSVDKIRSLTGKDHDDLIELCCSFLNGHSWQVMRRKVDPQKLFSALMAMAAVFGEVATADDVADDIKSADVLYDAAKAHDPDAIDTWAREHAEWDRMLPAQTIGDAAKAVAAHTAMFFVK